MPDFKKIKCLIVDDEPKARDLISQFITQVPSLSLVGTCVNALEAFAKLQELNVDLIFLDIQMPQLKGTDFLKALHRPPKVIFTTAFSEYAIESYDLNAVDYLLKPIPFDRFLKAVYKAFPQGKGLQHYKPEPEENQGESFVYFRADRKMVKVLLHDILFIESMKDYIKVYTVHGIIITRQSISSVEQMLPDCFIRVHRSFVISVNHIKTFTNELIGIGNKEIPIGKLFRNEVLKQLNHAPA